jgi:hypothetical protein
LNRKEAMSAAEHTSDWQSALDPQLTQRLTRPLVRPGVISRDLATSVQARGERMISRSPLMSELVQRQGSVAANVSGQLPIVTAQALRRQEQSASPAAPAAPRDLPRVGARPAVTPVASAPPTIARSFDPSASAPPTISVRPLSGAATGAGATTIARSFDSAAASAPPVVRSSGQGARAAGDSAESISGPAGTPPVVTPRSTTGGAAGALRSDQARPVVTAARTSATIARTPDPSIAGAETRPVVRVGATPAIQRASLAETAAGGTAANGATTARPVVTASAPAAPPSAPRVQRMAQLSAAPQSAPIQRAVAPASSPTTSTPAPSLPVVAARSAVSVERVGSGVISRALDSSVSDEPPPSAVEAAPVSVTSTTEKAAASPVDTEALVDSVLRKLSRQLAVEQERRGLQRWP